MPTSRRSAGSSLNSGKRESAAEAMGSHRLPEDDEHEQLHDWLLDEIERHGNAVVEVAGDEHGAPYVFSVGAWQRFRVPEAVAIGLPDGMGRGVGKAHVGPGGGGGGVAPGRLYHRLFDGVPPGGGRGA